MQSLSNLEFFNFIHPVLACFLVSVLFMALSVGTVKKALKVRRTPIVKQNISVGLCYVSFPIIFLMLLSWFHPDVLFVGEEASLLEKPLNKILGILVHWSSGGWHLWAVTGMAGLGIGMFLVPHYVEEYFSSPLKHLVYTAVSGGLYLPYLFLCFLFEPSTKESLKRGTKVIHDPRESASLLKKKQEATKA